MLHRLHSNGSPQPLACFSGDCHDEYKEHCELIGSRPLQLKEELVERLYVTNVTVNRSFLLEKYVKGMLN